MYIEKVLNNNAFISLDENGDEIIVMGKGIALERKEIKKLINQLKLQNIFV